MLAHDETLLRQYWILQSTSIVGCTVSYLYFLLFSEFGDLILWDLVEKQGPWHKNVMAVHTESVSTPSMAGSAKDKQTNARNRYSTLQHLWWTNIAALNAQRNQWFSSITTFNSICVQYTYCVHVCCIHQDRTSISCICRSKCAKPEWSEWTHLTHLRLDILSWGERLCSKAFTRWPRLLQPWFGRLVSAVYSCSPGTLRKEHDGFAMVCIWRHSPNIIKTLSWSTT